MRKILNVDEVKKGDKILVKENSPMWNSIKQNFTHVCFEYVFEVIRNNPKTLGCMYINGPHKKSRFSWTKGYDLTVNKKEYFLIENDAEIINRHYDTEKPQAVTRS